MVDWLTALTLSRRFRIIETMRGRSSLVLVFATMALATGCGDDGGGGTGGAGASGSTGAGAADTAAGSTVLVALVNPIVNEGNETEVPAELGDERQGLSVDAEPGGDDVTDDAGLAVVEVAEGALALTIGGAPALDHTVVAKGDLYDAAIAYDDSGSAFFENTPVRYAVGVDAGAILYTIDDELTEIESSLSTAGTVVVLRPGTYVGDLSITGDGVVLFGEGWSERAVVIEGHVTALGEGVRLRGLTITGDLTANSDEFGISFSVVHGETSIPGDGGAYLRNVFCGATTVPSSSATLLDNAGVPPIEELPTSICP